MEWIHFPSATRGPGLRIGPRARGFIRWIASLAAVAAAATYVARPAARAVIVPARRDVTVSITYPGTIHSGRAHGIGTTSSGTVARIAVRPGQLVRPGDLLFVLDAAPLRDEIHTLEQSIQGIDQERRDRGTRDPAPRYRQEESQALRQRQEELRAAAQEARQELAVRYGQLARMKRTSPVGGIVTEIRTRAGQEVSVGSPVVRIEDPASLRVRLLVDEQDRPKVRLGERAWIQVTSPAPDVKVRKPEHEERTGFPGRVVRVTPGMDGELWQAWVTLRPTGPPPAFRDGQRVAVRIVTARFPRALVLPAAALRRWRTGTVVYVANGNQVEERAVNAIRGDRGEMAILAGLAPTDTVILHPRQVHAGERILAERP